MMRATRRKLKLKQSELAALAGVSLETVVRYERCKQVSVTTDARIGEAILRMVMKKNPEAVKQAVQPMLEQAEKWEKMHEKIHSVEPGTELALELEALVWRRDWPGVDWMYKQLDFKRLRAP
jgi:transcriptional regulator with XRE-family HTH domain